MLADGLFQRLFVLSLSLAFGKITQLEREGMLRKKGFWILVILVVLAAGAGGAYYYQHVYSAGQAPEEEPLQTATVRRGEIVISASGAGTVIPAAEMDPGFQSSGTLTELLVDVGDRVNEGDVLARLDDTQARKALIAAELALLQAEDALAEQLDTSRAEQDLALAEANLAIAQLKLDELLNWAPDESTVDQAQSSLEAAQAD
jgi:multidrug efflux pump subunit AcrA (membrane-fusion protein)